MTKVERIEDCGNSPKNKLAEDLSIALATSDVTFLLDRLSDDIRWDIVGKQVIVGKKDFVEHLGEVRTRTPLRLTIHNVATHGKSGAVNGRCTFGQAATREFCDVFEFSSATAKVVKAITSYLIDSP